MTINLKQIQVFDTDNIKLDKINYNFDQLIVNGGGPKGYIGPDGNTGPQGFKGVQGVQGDRGYQGYQGPNAPDSTTYWESVPSNLSSGGSDMAPLFSKHPITNPQYASVVTAGYITGDTKYAQQQLDDGLPIYQWVINRNSSKVASNLRFTSGGVLGNAFDITMDNSIPQGLLSSEYRLYLGFINNQNSQLNLNAQQHVFKTTGNPILNAFNISNLSGVTYRDTFFEKPVKFNAALAIEDATADTNKIVTAVDNTGLVTFKTTEELGGSVKIGTIVSILPSIFSNGVNFISYQLVSTALNPNIPLQIKIGCGIGQYSGWYVCNGQRWTDGVITDSNNPDFYKWQVPDLNSYSFQIISNPISSDPNSQGYILVTNDEIQLIGGAPIYVDANETGISSAQYDISLTNNSNDPQIATNNTGIQFKIKKLPQIIYLGVNNLYWSQLGTDQLTVGDFSSGDFTISDYNAS